MQGVRSIMALVVLAVFGASMQLSSYSIRSDIAPTGAARTVKVSKSNVPEVFRLCGFPIPFLHNYNLVSAEKPDGCSKTQVEDADRSDLQHFMCSRKVQPNILSSSDV